MTYVEVPFEEGCFRVWLADGSLHCVKKVGNNEIVIDYWNQIPQELIPQIKKAVNSLFPRFSFCVDPTTQSFRYYHRGSCGGPCPEFAA